MSAGYRFCLREYSDHIAAIRLCECSADVDAVLEADAVLQSSRYPTVEVWNGSRCVAILSKPPTPPR